MSKSVNCQLCGGTIGVYEPLITLIDGSPHETSRAAIHDPGSLSSLCFHRLCFERQQAEESPLGHQDHGPAAVPRPHRALTT
jgi:hypothetical protein